MKMPRSFPTSHGHAVALLLIGPEFSVRAAITDITSGSGVYTVLPFSARILDVLEMMSLSLGSSAPPVAIVHGIRSREALQTVRDVFAIAGLPHATVWTAPLREDHSDVRDDPGCADAGWRVVPKFGDGAPERTPRAASVFLLVCFIQLTPMGGVAWRLRWNDHLDLRSITLLKRRVREPRPLLDPLTIAFARARKAADELARNYNRMATRRHADRASSVVQRLIRRDTEHGYDVISASAENPNVVNEAWAEFRVEDLRSEDDAASTQ